jgi:hypothetical protein
MKPHSETRVENIHVPESFKWEAKRKKERKKHRKKENPLIKLN